MESEDGVGLRRRVLAVASMVAGAALVVVTVVFAARHVGALLLGVAGLALVAGGAWWVVTERMPRRVIGVAGVAVGAVLVVVAVFNATPDVDRPVLRLVIVAVLFLVMVGCSRAALVSELHERDSRRPLEVTPPRHPVLLCNPWSGGGKVEKFGLVELAESMGVEVVMLDHGLDLETLARDAVARGADCLGMAGGDGSQALVASIAVEHDLPFVCVSAGTRNHFALDLGIDRDDPRLSLDAFRDAVERRIDYATVGDRLFVNNVSLGIYATIVQQEGYRDAKVDTTKALCREMLGRTDRAVRPPVHRARRHRGRRRLPDPGVEQPLRARRDPRRVPTPPPRHRHASGWSPSPPPPGPKRPASWPCPPSASGAGVGTGTSSPPSASRCGRARVRAYAGVDGEALELDTPLEFRIHPRGLRLLVPEGNLTAAERRQARNVSISDLLAIARGIDPLEARDQ